MKIVRRVSLRDRLCRKRCSDFLNRLSQKGHRCSLAAQILGGAMNELGGSVRMRGCEIEVRSLGGRRGLSALRSKTEFLYVGTT